jgi:hypothetical protein
MSTAVREHTTDADLTDERYIILNAIKLGLLEALLVLLFSLASRFLNGPVERILEIIVVVVGVAAVVSLPGIWTRPRTIEGIGGAAGIGLGATIVFLLLDVSILQPLGTWGDRWLAIGGGSNWWYHPVWWMVGTYMPWMGAFILSNQAARGGASVPKLLISVLIGAIVFALIGILIHVPHAGWTLGTFAVAVLPALAAVCLISGLEPRRA